MDDPASFISALRGGTFTFLVGFEKQKFEMHANIISNHSEAFDRMMHGHMRESIDKVAELPTVDPEVFTRFASFCYYANYNTPPVDNERTSPPRTASRFAANSANLAVAFMNLEETSLFYCYRCAKQHKITDSYTQFPYCNNHCAGNKSRKVLHCTRCSKPNPDGIGLLCHRCLLQYRGSFQQGNLYENAVIALKVAKFDKLVQQFPSLVPPVTECLQRLKSEDRSDDLIGRVKVFVFADMYDMLELKALAVCKLAFDLHRFPVTEDEVAQVMELLDYVYENTYSDSENECHGDLVRKLVVEFAASHADVLMKSDEFGRLISDGGVMVLDLVKAITMY